MLYEKERGEGFVVDPGRGEGLIVDPGRIYHASVAICRAFFSFSPCNHIINIKKIFFRRSKRQRNFSLLFSLLFFAS